MNVYVKGLLHLACAVGIILVSACTVTREGPVDEKEEPVEGSSVDRKYTPMEVTDVAVSTMESDGEAPPKLQLRLELSEPLYETGIYAKSSTSRIYQIKYGSYTGYHWNEGNKYPDVFDGRGWYHLIMVLSIAPVVDLVGMPIQSFRGDFGGGANGAWPIKEHTVIEESERDIRTYMKETRVERGDIYDLSKPVMVEVNGEEFLMETNWIILKWNEKWWQTLSGDDVLKVKFPFEDKPRVVSLAPAWAAYDRFVAGRTDP
jgi:hypothetical protein